MFNMFYQPDRKARLALLQGCEVSCRRPEGRAGELHWPGGHRLRRGITARWGQAGKSLQCGGHEQGGGG